mmetsp:Transcript_10105/g.26838  ORF Transcript_10105/g.26838 Transcript_10105/m.26838 type:complete len:472 (-) Transcript_10105:8-1423(-)
MSCFQACFAFIFWWAASALECGTWITNDCFGTTDIRYNPDYPLGLIEQDSRWKHYEGFWAVEVNRYGEDGRIEQPQLFDPRNRGRMPYKNEKIKGFYNHTFVGSRFIMDRYYVYAPPDAEFCNQTVLPHQKSTLSKGGGSCGTHGIAYDAGGYGTSTYEKNGEMIIFKGYGLYSRTTGSVARWLDGYTLMDSNGDQETYRNMNLLVHLDEDYTVVSATSSHFRLGADAGLRSQIVIAMTKVTEAEFLQGIRQAYTDYNVLPVDQVQGGMLPMETRSLDDPDAYPTEEEWCQQDPACSESPYQEKPATLKAGPIAGFVSAFAVIIITGLLILHWYRMKQQAHRYRQNFMKRIAENIHLEGHLSCLTEEQLGEEFKLIDKSGDGYIQKEEMRDFMMSGKAGKLSQSDFNAMWVALDLDHSGKVDIIEFCTFLSRCGGEYDEVANNQGALSREDKHKHAIGNIARKGAHQGDAV